MEYLLKCEQTPQSLCRPEAAMTNDEKSSEKNPPIKLYKHPGVKRERIFFFGGGTQRITWMWTSPLIPKDKQINMVPTGRTETSLAGWWGQTLVTGPFRAVEPTLVQSTGRRMLPAPASHLHSWHLRCWDNFVYSSSHKMKCKFLCICPEEAIMIPFLLHLIVFNWEQSMMAIHKIHIFKTMFLHVANTIYSTGRGWERGRKPNQMDCLSFRISSAYSID